LETKTEIDKTKKIFIYLKLDEGKRVNIIKNELKTLVFIKTQKFPYV
jgi:hypothetical protein